MIGLESYSKQVSIYLDPILIYISLRIDCLFEIRKIAVCFPWLSMSGDNRVTKLHKTPYKARFIANLSSCTTTELSTLLTSCLTAVKNHVIRYCEKVYERSGKNLFWPIKNSGEVLNKLKSRGFRATS